MYIMMPVVRLSEQRGGIMESTETKKNMPIWSYNGMVSIDTVDVMLELNLNMMGYYFFRAYGVLLLPYLITHVYSRTP
jgi:hypothetical protein